MHATVPHMHRRREEVGSVETALPSSVYAVRCEGCARGCRHGQGGGENVDLLCLFTPIYLLEIVSPIKGNCFKTSHLLMENNFGRSPKFFLRGYFFSNLGTIDVLIELYPMVPLVEKVPLVQSKPTFWPKSPPGGPSSLLSAR